MEYYKVQFTDLKCMYVTSNYRMLIYNLIYELLKLLV